MSDITPIFRFLLRTQNSLTSSRIVFNLELQHSEDRSMSQCGRVNEWPNAGVICSRIVRNGNERRQ